MTKNIEKLAERGGISLKQEIETNIKKIFDCVNYLAEEELDYPQVVEKLGRKDEIDLNKFVAIYLGSRNEYVDCDLDPYQYDIRVLNALNGLEHIKLKFEKIIQGENKNEK